MPSRQSNIRFYSQHGEDCLLWDFFEYIDFGYFVEVGAFDGVYLSNTYSFEQHGWIGICVEPSSELFKLCEKNRPGSICIEAACVGNDNLMNVTLEVERSGLLSTVVMQDEGRHEVDEVTDVRKETVRAVTLNKILMENLPVGKNIDLVSIDVEGNEVDVLAGFDVAYYKPRVVILEANTPVAEQRLMNVMCVMHSYIFARKLGVNMIFVRDSIDEKKIRNVAIECSIEKQVHPFGLEYSLKPFLKGKVYSDILSGQLAKKDEHIASLKVALVRRLEVIRRLSEYLEKCRKESEGLKSEMVFQDKIEKLLRVSVDIFSKHDSLILLGNRAIVELLVRLYPNKVLGCLLYPDQCEEPTSSLPVIGLTDLNKRFFSNTILVVDIGLDTNALDCVAHQCAVDRNRLIALGLLD